MKFIEWGNDYDKYLTYLESDTWAKLRNKALERDNYHCSICKSPYNLEVHHLKYPDVLGTEPLSDLITLCSNCHKKLEEYKKGHINTKKYAVWHAPHIPKKTTWFQFENIDDYESRGMEIVNASRDPDGKAKPSMIYLKQENRKMNIFLTSEAIKKLTDIVGADNVKTTFQ